MKRRMLLCLAALAPGYAMAAEADWGLLHQRLHQAGPAEFRYEETRSLELMAKPWHGQGYLLSGADGSLVKLQLSPQRVIMAISGPSMYYYDPGQGQRRSAALSYAGDAAEQISVFRAILQGRPEDLRARYELTAESHGETWRLRLSAKTKATGSAMESVEIAGGADPLRRQVSIRQADGETTDYRLEKTNEGQALEFSVQRLLQEAAGD